MSEQKENLVAPVPVEPVAPRYPDERANFPSDLSIDITINAEMSEGGDIVVHVDGTVAGEEIAQLHVTNGAWGLSSTMDEVFKKFTKEYNLATEDRRKRQDAATKVYEKEHAEYELNKASYEASMDALDDQPF